MNKKEWKKQQVIEDHAYKAWKERDQFTDRALENWLKEGEMTAEEFSQQSNALRTEIAEVINNHHVPLGMVRLTLMTLMSESLAMHAMDLDQVGRDAAVWGETLVHVSMQMFAGNCPMQ